jgi:hypothetical protein
VSLTGAAAVPILLPKAHPTGGRYGIATAAIQSARALVLVIGGAGRCEARTRCLMDCQYLRSLGGVAKLQQTSKYPRY